MPFVALIANLKPTAGDHIRERGSVMDATASPTALYELLSALDPDLMPTLRCSLERYLLTLALLKQGRGAFSLRVTALAEEGLSSMSALLQAIACSPVLTWQRGEWALEATDMTQSRWAGISDWADFMAKPKGRTLTFHFGTPLVLPAQTEGDRGSIAHFPHPRPVFEMLARKWQELGGPALPSDVLSLCDQGGCVVSDYRLSGSRIPLPDRNHLGFLGWIAYQCRSESGDCIAALTALARFAFFAGVGCLTSWGMGATRIRFGE
jgi:CRISPR-associated endoribonuclease Cas6